MAELLALSPRPTVAAQDALVLRHVQAALGPGEVLQAWAYGHAHPRHALVGCLLLPVRAFYVAVVLHTAERLRAALRGGRAWHASDYALWVLTSQRLWVAQVRFSLLPRDALCVVAERSYTEPWPVRIQRVLRVEILEAEGMPQARLAAHREAAPHHDPFVWRCAHLRDRLRERLASKATGDRA